MGKVLSYVQRREHQSNGLVNVLAEKVNAVRRDEIARFEEGEWEIITDGSSFLVDYEIGNSMCCSVCILRKDGLVGPPSSKTRFIMGLLSRMVDRAVMVIGL